MTPTEKANAKKVLVAKWQNMHIDPLTNDIKVISYNAKGVVGKTKYEQTWRNPANGEGYALEDNIVELHFGEGWKHKRQLQSEETAKTIYFGYMSKGTVTRQLKRECPFCQKR